MLDHQQVHAQYLREAGQCLSIPPDFSLFSSAWRSPSNIALVKYWGKKEGQIPANPSLSLTLRESFTETQVEFSRNNRKGISFRFLFDGSPKPSFEPKIRSFLEKMLPYLPFLAEVHLEIKSRNSFPHSAGIASSASAMSALAFCISDMEKHLTGHRPENEKLRKVSYMSRIGSGSACRSVYPGFVSWGVTGNYSGSSDEYALPLAFRIHERFMELNDAILVTDPGIKKISSSAGHGMMNHHPYAEARYRQAHLNHLNLRNALAIGNQDDFSRIVENEALSLHSLMMSSDPGYFLINRYTLEILDKIREFRKEKKVFICFTLDAGPNVHIIYGKEDKNRVEEFIRNDLMIYCPGEMIIFDGGGTGPARV